MPWHVAKSGKCSASKPYAVIKDSDGSVVGCHASKEKANKQLAALNASEVKSSMSTTEQNSRPPRDIIRAIPPAVRLRAVDGEDDGRPILFGHFARFNEFTEIDSVWEGHFMERIAPGAFKKTFRERRDQIRVLFQHGRDPELGDKPIAEIEEMREDDEGGYYEARLLDGIPTLLESGLRAGQYGQSFRMQVMREEVVDDPEPSEDNPHALREHTIKEIRLFEFGPVTFPAYANTEANVRSMNDEFIFGWLAREPQRARELLGATDLSRAAFDAANITQDPAPSQQSDAAPTKGTSAQERRDPVKGRYGLSQHPERPSWAL